MTAMNPDAFYDEDLRVLTPEAFEFVLVNELKRAMRSQNFLTLLVMDTSAEAPGDEHDPVRHVTRIVSHEVRETDLLARTPEGVSVVLLDADMNSTMRVIDRLMARVDHYEFPGPVSITVGAASCPTHGTDLESLRRAATARPVVTRRARRRASNA
jgi:PleD family two-component response regulator